MAASMMRCASAALVASPPLADNLTTDLAIAGGRIAVREVCVHAPNLEAVIQRGNDQELNNYMLAGRESGMTDFQTA
jgi:hypothetical protein